MRRPMAVSTSVVAAWLTMSEKSLTRACTTWTGVGSRKLGMIPRSTTSSHTTRSPATVRSGVSTRRARDAPARGAGAACGAAAALLAGSAALLGVSC